MSEALSVRWTFADSAGTEIMNAALAEHRFDPHFHETWSIGCIDLGTCSFRACGRTLTASAGDLVLLPPYMVHTGGSSAGRLAYRMAYVGERWLSSLSELVFNAPHIEFPRIVVHDPRLSGELSDALSPAPLPDAKRRARLAGTLIELLGRHGRPRPSCRETRRIRPEPAADAGSMLDAVRGGAVSRSALIRRFTRRFGLAPSRYLRNLRCVLAKELIRNGAAIAQVAQELGFSDQAHFTREFKKIHGITPGRYQHAGRGASAENDSRRRP